MPIGASLASAAVGAGASIYGANQASKASKAALNASLAQQGRVNTAVQPFVSAGQDALGRISNPNDWAKYFKASPDYQFRLGEGINAVATSKATNGLLRSGSALRAINDYAQNTAAGEFGNWFNRQDSLATLGKSGVDTMAGVANSSQQAIQANGANQGNAGIAVGNVIGQFGGSVADVIGRYGPGGGQSSFSLGGQNYSATPLSDPASHMVT